MLKQRKRIRDGVDRFFRGMRHSFYFYRDFVEPFWTPSWPTYADHPINKSTYYTYQASVLPQDKWSASCLGGKPNKEPWVRVHVAAALPITTLPCAHSRTITKKKTSDSKENWTAWTLSLFKTWWKTGNCLCFNVSLFLKEIKINEIGNSTRQKDTKHQKDRFYVYHCFYY